MPSKIRLAKLSELVRERVSEVVLFELKDPRVGFVTITRVKLTGDLHFGSVYYSSLGTEAEREITQLALDHAKGFIQSAVGKVLRTRSIPALTFVYDRSVEGSVRVSQIIDRIKKEREGESAEPPAGTGDAAEGAEPVESDDESEE